MITATVTQAVYMLVAVYILNQATIRLQSRVYQNLFRTHQITDLEILITLQVSIYRSWLSLSLSLSLSCLYLCVLL